MKKIIVSAPGKLMLFGEHAVVYNRPCIVTAVSRRIKVTVEFINNSIFELQAPDVQIINYSKPISDLGKGDPSTSSGQGIPKGATFVEMAVSNFYSSSEAQRSREVKSSKSSQQARTIKPDQGIKVTTASEFSSQFGFGSSSAVTVCVIKALSELFDIKLSEKELFDLAYKTVLDVQKKGSGFDVAAAIYGGTLYFVTGGKVIESLGIHSLPLVIGYSGIKADTVTLVNNIAEKRNTQPSVVENIFNEIAELVEEAKQLLLKSEWERLGKVMNRNQRLLWELGVSSKKLDAMIDAASNAGAYGAKLSGAGGGDCMIGVCPKEKRENVIDAIGRVGGKVIDATVNAEGVRIES